MKHFTRHYFTLLACWFSFLTLPVQAQRSTPTQRPISSLENAGLLRPETLVPMGRRPATVAQLQQRLGQRYITGSWQNESRYVYSRYNTFNLYGSQRSDQWRDGAWHMTSEMLRHYNASGQPVSDTLQSIQSFQRPVIEPLWAYAYGYTNGQLTQVNWFFNTDNPTWPLVERSTLSYNAAGQLTRLVAETYVQSGAPEPYYQAFYTYNSQGQLEVVDHYGLDVTNTLKLGSKMFYTYTPQGNVQQTRTQEVIDNSGLLQNRFRETYQYDAAGHLATKLNEDWHDSAWRIRNKNLYTYDAQDNLLSDLDQYLIDASFQDTHRYLYTYAQVTSARAAAPAPVSLTVAPNPVQGQAVLHYALPATATTGTVDILAATGQRVVTVKLPALGAAHVKLPTDALPAGIYLVRLRAGGVTGQTRLVVQ